MDSISHSTYKRRLRGFTLIELLIVLAIVAILVTAFTPNLRGAMARNQMIGQAHELAGAMSTARSEAITRGTQAGICASADGTTCSGSNNDWGKFILIFVDTDLGSDFDNTEPLLKSLTAHDEVSQSATVSAIFFSPSGFRTVNATSNIDLCHNDLDESAMCRRVTVGPSGLVAVTGITVSS